MHDACCLPYTVHAAYQPHDLVQLRAQSGLWSTACLRSGWHFINKVLQALSMMQSTHKLCMHASVECRNRSSPRCCCRGTATQQYQLKLLTGLALYSQNTQLIGLCDSLLTWLDIGCEASKQAARAVDLLPLGPTCSVGQQRSPAAVVTELQFLQSFPLTLGVQCYCMQHPFGLVCFPLLLADGPECVTADSRPEGGAPHRGGIVKHKYPHPWRTVGASQRGGDPV